MFAANVIAVEDCPNGRSTCKECGQAISQSQARIRTEQRRYCHLACYRPRYPVAINLHSDVLNKLQLPANQGHFDLWLRTWNSQFQPLDPNSLTVGTVPAHIDFSRMHIEIFKFLTHKEVCTLIGATCRQWRQWAWAEELWLTLAERDYPEETLQPGVSAREGYIHVYAQACIGCRRIPQRSSIRVVCPTSKRPICASCFLKPGSSLFPVADYCSLLGVSQTYIRDAHVPVYSYSDKNWVFSHQADQCILEMRSTRRREMLSLLDHSTHSFSRDDLLKIKCLNLTRAKYIGVVLKHKFEGEEDLIDLLNYIYSASGHRGMTVDTLLRRNKRRRRLTTNCY